MLADEVHRHVPLTAVADWVTEQEADCSVVDWAVGGVDDSFVKVVGSLKFVPEVDVGLAEFEILDVEFLHCARAEEVEGCEEPASTAAHLMGDLPLVEFCRESEVDFLHFLAV